MITLPRLSLHRTRTPSLVTLLVLVSMMLLLVAVPAHAADLFAPVPGDMSMKLFVKPLFGPVVDGSSSPLSGILGAFNAGVLFLGGIFAAYTIIAGTMSTAHDGELLGKKWSSMWIPVRTSVGTAAILPTMKGFCAAQAIVVWLAIQGIGLADTVWSQFASNPLGSDGQVYTGVDMTSNVRKLATSLLLANVCAESANQAIAKDRASGGMGGRMFGSMTFGPTPFSNTSSSGQVRTGYTYGETSDRLGLQAACGSVTLTLSAPSPKSGIEPTGQTQEQLVNVQNVTAVVEKAHQTALPALQAAMNALAKQVVDPNSKVSAHQAAEAIDIGVNAYAQAIEAIGKAAAAQQVDTDYINAMRADGWAYAGLYYVKIVKAQSDIAAAISAIPSSDGMSSTSRAALSLFVDDIDVNLNKANDILADAARRDATGLAQNNADGGSGADRIVAWFATGKSVVDSTLSGGGQVNANPLLAVVELGHSMMWWGESAFTAASSVSVLGVIPRVSNVMQLVYTIISGPFALMFSVLVGGGAMLAVYLPMIPTLMWYTAVFSWVVTLAEAVIAAPIWMCMHLHPSGEETGKASSGYSLILSLTVRPALMVLGLCMAIEILPLAGGFVMGTFAIAFHMSVTSGHFAGLFITLAGCVMFVTTMVLIIRKTFSLIHVIPDQILTWIGNGAGQLGSTIREMDGTAHNKVAAAFSHTTKMAGAAGGGLGNALGRDPKGKGNDGGSKPDRDAGITVGPREPEIDHRRGKHDDTKGKTGKEAAGGEGSLSEARRAAKETEGGAAGARSDAVPIARKADVQNEEPQGGGSATPTSKSGAQEEKPAARERVAQVTERPATERKTTLAEDLAAFRASFDSRDEKAKSANGESERHT